MDQEQQIKTNQCIEIKPGYYNFVLDKPLKSRKDENIQYIIKVDRNYAIASITPLTAEDINNINLKEWDFKSFKEWKAIWKSKIK